MKKFNLMFVILLFLISSLAYAATWENFKTEKIEITDGIYKEIKTYSSGKIEEAIMMKIDSSDVTGYFEVELVDGEYQLTEEGLKAMNNKMSSPGGC